MECCDVKVFARFGARVPDVPVSHGAICRSVLTVFDFANSKGVIVALMGICTVGFLSYRKDKEVWWNRSIKEPQNMSRDESDESL